VVLRPSESNDRAPNPVARAMVFTKNSYITWSVVWCLGGDVFFGEVPAKAGTTNWHRLKPELRTGAG